MGHPVQVYYGTCKKVLQKNPSFHCQSWCWTTYIMTKPSFNGLQIFSHILKREFHEPHIKHLSRKFTEWAYGPVQCFLYDLATVDSYEDKSVVEILVYGSDIPVSPVITSPARACLVAVLPSDIWLPVPSQNRHEMLQTEPLSRLLDEKWKRFAGRMFFFSFLFYLVYLIIFTLVAYNKQDEEVSSKWWSVCPKWTHAHGANLPSLPNSPHFLFTLRWITCMF